MFFFSNGNLCCFLARPQGMFGMHLKKSTIKVFKDIKLHTMTAWYNRCLCCVYAQLATEVQHGQGLYSAAVIGDKNKTVKDFLGWATSDGISTSKSSEPSETIKDCVWHTHSPASWAKALPNKFGLKWNTQPWLMCPTPQRGPPHPLPSGALLPPMFWLWAMCGGFNALGSSHLIAEQKFLLRLSVSLPGDTRDLLFSLPFLPHLSVLSAAAGAGRVFGRAQHCFHYSPFQTCGFQCFICTAGVHPNILVLSTLGWNDFASL